MATYTDNYQLTKPTYAEQADIRVINSNMNKIDEIMHSSQISLAPAYDQSQTYAEGDVVMYELLMYKCISPTTGVWDASKWERTTASESGGGGSAELDILGEGNGAVVSFSDGASAELVKCIADINPVQDLHGYDKPWAGGAGKNLFPMTVNEIKTNNVSISWNGNVGIIYGMTITLHTDDGISVSKISISGTPTNTAYLYVGAFNLKSGVSYVLNGCPSNKPDNDVLYVSNQPSGFGSWVDSGNGATYNATQDWNGISFFIRIWANVAQNNDWYPMIRLATETDATFEPYSNICPISGHSSVTINVSPTSEPAEGIDTTIQLGDTYYGGTLNVGKGELTIDRAIVDLGSFNWISESATVSGLARVGVEEIRPLGALYNQTPICSSYEGVAPKGYSAFNNGEIGFSNNEANPMIRVRDQNFASMTDAQIKSAMNGVQLCYFLATPQTVQLTPQEVNSLLGQNNISADTGDVDIVYVKASAPIQPNPTGTPTATLKKLGIEGTIFELESGGGGGNVYGAFVDTNRVIQASTDIPANTDVSYTATEDCAVSWTLIASNNSTYSVTIDGEAIASGWNQTGARSNQDTVFLRRGQTITMRQSYTNANGNYTVYGLTFGTQNIFTPQIYSTEERCVGVWKDNKPLYQKTIPFSNVSNSGTVSFGIADVDNIFLVSGKVSESSPLPYVHGSAPSNNVGGLFNISQADTGWSFRCGNDAPSTLSGWICVAYTKTTDTAGSGSYNTLGVPMVHYTTDEQVVGTDEAGNTVYEITKNNISITALSTWISTGISFNGDVISVDGVMTRDGEPIPLGIFNTSVYSTWIYRDGQIKVQQVGNSNETYTCKRITVRYTKSSS